MSAQVASARLTTRDIAARKGGEPLVCLTAYNAPVAAIFDDYADILLVGDSVGMVIHGLPSTIGVTLDMMILHGQAVMRGAKKAFVVIDLPFGSYEGGHQAAWASASRVMMETGAQAVKVESGQGVSDSIRFLVDRGVPVMGHVGLRPQAVNVDGGFRTKGRSQMEYDRVMNEALATEAAGAFAIVVEGVSKELADDVTKALKIPTIGIGASAACDGQILVSDDMLGMFEKNAKFVKKYADLRGVIAGAAEGYAAEVRARIFPDEAHTYGIKRT